MEKAYCKKCTHFGGDDCWYPELINMNNDCVWFEDKEIFVKPTSSVEDNERQEEDERN